ncbi:hypothetical protein KC19_VG243400 [Ceratodon purpureus]|uniref:Uncharacterized protein n=1 Tax=Ceratodon purpureus TaxID=3225 RepID=A0A8T0HT69_CERPU|nr:hypothetical protein KC19_VG243400 [Ceratodon purpureus]
MGYLYRGNPDSNYGIQAKFIADVFNQDVNCGDLQIQRNANQLYLRGKRLTTPRFFGTFSEQLLIFNDRCIPF